MPVAIPQALLKETELPEDPFGIEVMTVNTGILLCFVSEVGSGHCSTSTFYRSIPCRQRN